MQSFFTGRLGIRAQQQRMDAIAANISNLGTIGYKCGNTAFKDTLYTRISDSASVGKGTGVALFSTHRDFSAGQPLQTGVTLDFCIEGDGFFAVEGNGGKVMYTRNGNFCISHESGRDYLVTASGNYVLDENGGRITLPDGANVSLSDAGELTSGGEVFAALKLVTFTNKDGLSSAGGGCFEITETSGGEIPSNAKILQGYLESSNVDVTAQFAQMIGAQRAFSLCGRTLSAWNHMESEANNLRT